jgi:hypothetical protein
LGLDYLESEDTKIKEIEERATRNLVQKVNIVKGRKGAVFGIRLVLIQGELVVSAEASGRMGYD